MSRMLIFGLGYTGKFLAEEMIRRGWEVLSTGSAGTMAFDDRASVMLALERATHILSSVPPVSDGDPVLANYGSALRNHKGWKAYLSSTGVYGDTGGAWVDEGAPIKGRRANRNQADADWQALGAHIFRLPGIYGPGRSVFERLEEGKAHRIDLPDQVFSRVHVDDIVSGVMAGFDAPIGVYNLSDNAPCSQNAVVEYASALMGIAPPPLLGIEEAGLSPMARAFYAENRRVANAKAKRVLRWQPKYADFRSGLAELALKFQ